jgi:hypothetical protein
MNVKKEAGDEEDGRDLDLRGGTVVERGEHRLVATIRHELVLMTIFQNRNASTRVHAVVIAS